MQYGYREASWKDNKLFIRNKNTGVSLIPRGKLYNIKWSDGTIDGPYNGTRAKDNSVRSVIYQWNRDLDKELEGRTEALRGTTGALK